MGGHWRSGGADRRPRGGLKCREGKRKREGAKERGIDRDRNGKCGGKMWKKVEKCTGRGYSAVYTDTKRNERTRKRPMLREEKYVGARQRGKRRKKEREGKERRNLSGRDRAETNSPSTVARNKTLCHSVPPQGFGQTQSRA